MFRFSIRDVLWLTVVVGLSVSWWRDHWTLKRVEYWWNDHVVKYHESNPNEYKRLMMWERPPR